jgi:phage baseplate assembly protein W
MSKILSDFNITAKASSNIARTRLYSDLNLGFAINPITKDINPVTDIDAVKNSLKNLMLTNFYDRPFQPTLGSGLTRLLFESANVFTIMELKDAIEKVINNHEPRVTDVNVDVIDNSDLNEYRVTIYFRVFYDDSVNSFDFFLTRLR